MSSAVDAPCESVQQTRAIFCIAFGCLVSFGGGCRYVFLERYVDKKEKTRVKFGGVQGFTRQLGVTDPRQ